MAFAHLHIQIEEGLKRRAQQAADTLELRNVSAFVRMAIAEKVNAVLGKSPPIPLHMATMDKPN